DYDLQVYYLFANFIEYLESFPASQEMISFIQKRYAHHQNYEMFEAISQTFGIDEKYKENLLLLFMNAKLPLKLLLFKEALDLLQELAINRKQIFILTVGDPKQQLNKIKQTEWNGLDKYLKVYFTDEFEKKPSTMAIQHILLENQLNKEEVVIIGKMEEDRVMAENCGIDNKSLF
ncbi:MAG: HAD hydrolase-like protein, partial [Bacteroidetes bacterium]|nr:HAD hydrolase-like protein [Bacteroidota bacterium]